MVKPWFVAGSKAVRFRHWEPMKLEVYTDGSTEKANPAKRAAYAWIVKVEGTIKSQGVKIFEGEPVTNNDAEFRAVEAVLFEIRGHYPEATEVNVHTDSKLVVQILNHAWQCKAPNLKPLRDLIWEHCDALPDCKINFIWIPREMNSEADVLSKSIY